MLKTVRHAIELHDDALDFTVAEGIVRFDEFTGDERKGREFFETTYITDGLDALLRGATTRLAGKNTNASFHLKQAMGGGKTHSIAALAFLARHPNLRNEILPDLPAAREFNSIRFAAFNGRERPENFMWGHIVQQLGGEEFLERDPSIPPDEATWHRIFKKSQDPILIVLDELPPYFQDLATYSAGQGTLADRATRAFAGMLTAAHNLTNVCVVVSDLTGTYEVGSDFINQALRSAQGELNRQEVDITPVDLESEDAYQILRKRLIRSMPEDDVIDAVAESYARALQTAEAANIVDKGAEQITREIRSSYPFHPELKHLFAMFSNNLQFRQTRGLMELGSLLLKSVWANDFETYLVGPQHFDLALRQVRDRLGEISRLESAIASDVYDASGGSTAQTIDADLGNRSASEAASLLLTASLSTVGNESRGLRKNDALAILIHPNGGEEDYSAAIDRLYERASYMHKTPEGRLYFDRLENLNVLLEKNAINAPENRVNEIIARRLEEVFDPTEKTAYEELVNATDGIDPYLERIQRRRVLLAVRPDGKLPPEEVERLFESVAEKNNVFVLTGQRSFEASKLTDAARKLYATTAAQRDVTKDNPQYEELMQRHESAETQLTQAIVGTFDHVLVPVHPPNGAPQLKKKPIQLPAGSAKGAGERVIIDVLRSAPKKLVTDVSGDEFDALKAKVEGVLWGTDDVAVYADVERRARENASAYWVPPRGMEALRDTAIQRGHWEDMGNGRISKVIRPKVPKVQFTVTKEPTPTDDRVVLDVHTADASERAVVHWAENRAATEEDPTVQGGTIESTAVAIPLLIVDPSRSGGETEDRSDARWENPLNVAHELEVDPATQERRVRLYAHDEATLRYTLDGTNAREHGTPYDGGAIPIGPERHTLLVFAEYTSPDAIVFEGGGTFDIPAHAAGANDDPWQGLDPAAPSVLTADGSTLRINDRAGVYRALDVMREHDVRLVQPELVLQRNYGAQQQVHVRVTGDTLEVGASSLRGLLEGAHATLGNEEESLSLRFTRVHAPHLDALKTIADALTDRIKPGQVRQ